MVTYLSQTTTNLLCHSIDPEDFSVVVRDTLAENGTGDGREPSLTYSFTRGRVSEPLGTRGRSPGTKDLRTVSPQRRVPFGTHGTEVVSAISYREGMHSLVPGSGTRDTPPLSAETDRRRTRPFDSVPAGETRTGSWNGRLGIRVGASSSGFNPETPLLFPRETLGKSSSGASLGPQIR